MRGNTRKWWLLCIHLGVLGFAFQNCANPSSGGSTDSASSSLGNSISEPTVATNLFPFGNFESGLGQLKYSGEPTIVAAHTGQKGLRISEGGAYLYMIPSPSEKGIPQPPIVAGKTYRFSFWGRSVAKVAGGYDPQVSLYIDISMEASGGIGKSFSITQSTWNYYEFQFTYPMDGYQYYMGLEMSLNTPGNIIDVDDVKLEEVKDAPVPPTPSVNGNLLPFGSFESDVEAGVFSNPLPKPVAEAAYSGTKGLRLYKTGASLKSFPVLELGKTYRLRFWARRVIADPNPNFLPYVFFNFGQIFYITSSEWKRFEYQFVHSDSTLNYVLVFATESSMENVIDIDALRLERLL